MMNLIFELRDFPRSELNSVQMQVEIGARNNEFTACVNKIHDSKHPASFVAKSEFSQFIYAVIFPSGQCHL